MTDRIVRTVAFKPHILKLLDDFRGDMSRSYVINRLIELYFEEEEDRNAKSFEMGQI